MTVRKLHLARSSRDTWCGRLIQENAADGRPNRIPRGLVTHARGQVNCLVCLKADEAEQRKEDAAAK